MSDIDKALAYVREDIELSRSLGDGEDLAEMRRIETLLMKQERMEAEWDALRDELKAMADRVSVVAQEHGRLRESLQKSAGALQVSNSALGGAEIRFKGKYSHFGTMEISLILDEANEALEGGA